MKQAASNIHRGCQQAAFTEGKGEVQRRRQKVATGNLFHFFLQLHLVGFHFVNIEIRGLQFLEGDNNQVLTNLNTFSPVITSSSFFKILI